MHEFAKRISLAVAKGVADKGSVFWADVGHDDWCGIYDGEECNCDPEITIRTRDGKVQILADGTIQRLN